jgi:hypothetical protein
MDEFAPAMLVEHDYDGASSRYTIVLNPYGPIDVTTNAVFERHGLEALGYAWHGVADALKRVAGLIHEAADNPKLLEEAQENADPDLLA